MYSPSQYNIPASPAPNEPMHNVLDPKSQDDVELGSLQDSLATNLGYYVVIEFLIGTQNIIVKDGILYSVGINYVTLYQEDSDRYVVCDMYSIKFVNFYNSKTKPQD